MKPSGINMVVMCPNLRLRNTLIRVLKTTACIVPTRKGDNQVAKRAYYPEAMTRTIINAPNHELWVQLGAPCVAITVTVENPMDAAEVAKEIFESAGYPATIHPNIEPGLPENFMAFLEIPAFGGTSLLFWPKEESVSEETIKAFHATGEFGPWTADEYFTPHNSSSHTSRARTRNTAGPFFISQP